MAQWERAVQRDSKSITGLSAVSLASKPQVPGSPGNSAGSDKDTRGDLWHIDMDTCIPTHTHALYHLRHKMENSLQRVVRKLILAHSSGGSGLMILSSVLSSNQA